MATLDKDVCEYKLKEMQMLSHLQDLVLKMTTHLANLMLTPRIRECNACKGNGNTARGDLKNSFNPVKFLETTVNLCGAVVKI